MLAATLGCVQGYPVGVPAEEEQTAVSAVWRDEFDRKQWIGCRNCAHARWRRRLQGHTVDAYLPRDLVKWQEGSWYTGTHGGVEMLAWLQEVKGHICDKLRTLHKMIYHSDLETNAPNDLQMTLNAARSLKFPHMLWISLSPIFQCLPLYDQSF